MARILGINIPDHKRSEIALRSIYGIGRTLSRKILVSADVELNKKAKELTPDEIKKISDLIQRDHTTEGDLRRERQMNIKRLKDIGSWRGLRHTRGLPVRGQKTKTNTRTVRGNVRRTTTSGKRKLDKK